MCKDDIYFVIRNTIIELPTYHQLNLILRLGKYVKGSQGRLSPLSGGSQPPPQPLQPPPLDGQHGTCIIICLPQVGVSESEEMIKASIIIGGGGKVELLEWHHYSLWAQTMQWLKLFINTCETLNKIPNLTPKLYHTHLFLSFLSQITANWSEGCMQSYTNSSSWGQGPRLSRQRFVCFLDWTCRILCNLNWSIY